MRYIHPSIKTEQIHPITSWAQSVADLIASCSGSCTEPGYSAYPNYVSCENINNNHDVQFNVFLPGNNIGSQANLLNTCSILINGSPINESSCSSYQVNACGDIGFTYFLRCSSSGSCPTTVQNVTLSCSSVQTEGPCTYDLVT